MGTKLITPDSGMIIWTLLTFVILAFLLGWLPGSRCWRFSTNASGR